jgi:hypothetical protein
VLLLESVAHSRELTSYVKNKNQDLNLRERGECSSFGSQRSFSFFEWPTTLGVRWGSIYIPHLKRAVGGIVHWTSE